MVLQSMRGLKFNSGIYYDMSLLRYDTVAIGKQLPSGKYVTLPTDKVTYSKRFCYST